MKEFIIFILIFLVVFALALFIFNGRFIYAQFKYSILGPSPINKNFSFVQEKEFPQRIVISAVGIDAPIVVPEGIDEPVLQKALEKGVVYWPSSNLPQENGVIVILGHSSAYPWYGGKYGSVFSLLSKLQTGENIVIFDKDKEYNYRVVGKEIKAPKDLILEKAEDKSILYLVSCWPINTSWKRIVIKAERY